MSQPSVESILSRAMTDTAFADLLFTKPDEALAGYDLTAEEITNLKNLPRADFDALTGSTMEDRKSFALNVNVSETALRTRR